MADLKSLSPFKKNIKKNLSIIFLLVFFLVTATTLGVSYYFKGKKAKLDKEPLSVPLTLALTSPYDGMIITSNELVVQGKTRPHATVVFYSETDEDSIESDDEGYFEGTIVLENGVNTLIVTTFSETGEEKSVVVDVVYDESVKGKKTAKEPPGQAKKDDKEEKGKKTDNQAVVGNVEETAEQYLILTDKKGKKKVKTNIDEDTEIIGKDKNKNKLKFLKPKDKAAIITDEEASGSPKLKRALKVFHREATASAQLNRRALQGVITSLSASSITIAHQTQRDRVTTILINNDTAYKLKGVEDASLTDLTLGQRIVVIGDRDEAGVLTARRVHVIPGKAIGIFKRLPVATESAELESSPEATPASSPESTPSATPENSPEALPSIEPSPTLE
ncbi:DUF5666 domain-containing protein [Patescibacteria group bacterium]